MTSSVRHQPQFPNPNSVEVGKVISHSELADLIDIVLSTLGLIVSPVTDLFYIRHSMPPLTRYSVTPAHQCRAVHSYSQLFHTRCSDIVEVTYCYITRVRL